jgi:hypothetical protein
MPNFTVGAIVSDETKAAVTLWFTDLIKNVGVPTAVCGVLLFIGNQQLEFVTQRADKQDEFIRTTLVEELHIMGSQVDKGSAVIESLTQMVGILNETFRQLAVEQRETRAVLRESRTAEN